MNLLKSLRIRLFFLFIFFFHFLYALDFTKEEQDWISEHPIVTVGGDPNWLPFEEFNEEGEYRGIIADHLKEVEKISHLVIEPQNVGSWTETLKFSKHSKVDMISGDIDDVLLSKNYKPITPYLSAPIVIIMRSGNQFISDLHEIEEKKIAIIDRYGYTSSVFKKYSNIAFSKVNNIDLLFDGLINHKHDAILLSMPVASYMMNERGYTMLTIVGKSSIEMEVTLFVQKDKPELHAIMEKVMQVLSKTKQLDIMKRWQKIKFAKKTDYTTLYQIIGLFVLFILGTLYWSRKVKSEFQKRVESEKQMTMLTETIPLNVVVSDFEGNILRANAHAIQDFDSDEEEIYQYNVTAFYADPSERDGVMDIIKREGKLDERIIKFQRLDGRQKDMMLSIMPIVYNGHQALLTIMVDMTERLEMEEKLRQSKAVADSANKAKSEFLANMSHEIRTPMNAIVGFTELLNEQIKEPRLKAYAKTIKSAGQTLLTLINDILDLSKIEAGKLGIDKRAMNLFELCDDIGNMFLMTVRNKGLDLIIEIDENIPKSLLLDEIRLRQIIVNLLGNAVKFTEHGYVKLKVQAFNVDDHLSKLDLEISVEDTGIGIKEDQQQFIFKSFEQQEGQENRKYGGTGLGLTVSERLTEMMGGEISLKSETGKGATFFVHLYNVDISSVVVTETEPSHALNTKTILFTPGTVLVVDDIEDNRELIVRNFEDTRLTIVTAIDGFDAIEQFKNEKPDLILMDIRMPNMDGYEAAKKIKEMSGVPIIALTASVMKDEHERVKNENFDDYLRKPVLRDDLFLTLSHYLPYEHVIIDTVGEKTLVLGEKSQKNIDVILQIMEDEIASLYERAINGNNIADIKVFIDAVHTLAINYEIDVLEEYTALLNEATDAFDIAKIKILLIDYDNLKVQLQEIYKSLQE